VTLVIVLVALPIKTYALVTMNKQGWLTRRADLVGGEGQDESSLTASASAPSVPSTAGATA
jgi:hyaluronan synthase